MTRHMVWVEKLVNPRSVVLSLPEVAEFLQTIQKEIFEVVESDASADETRKKKLKQKAGHSEVVSGALNYLSTQSAASISPADVIKAFQILNKYKLTFLEKLNIVTMAPKQLADILCLLDDAGLRFSKNTLATLEEQCQTLFPDDAVEIKIEILENDNV